MPSRCRPLRFIRRCTQRRVAYQPGVYILAYHAIVDPAHAEQWEIAYDGGAVSLSHFEQQVAHLCREMVPVTLTKAFELMACGGLDQPYFAMTFDDGFSNVLKNAAPVVARCGVQPCMFVNGRMAQGHHVYYRVLAALLTRSGHAAELRNELMAQDNRTAWQCDPHKLFNQTKDCYTPGLMEDAVEGAYVRCFGEPAALGVHLNPGQIRRLQSEGWEIGNHTFDHQLLSRLNEQQIDETIARNEAFLHAERIPLVEALAIPNGAVRDVNAHVNAWLQKHRSVHALFCNGGFNVKYDRTQCLRLFGGNGDERSLQDKIRAEVHRVNRYWKQVESTKRTDRHV